MIQKQVGTKDVLPQDSFKWHKVENMAREVASLFNVKEIRTPTFEATALFERGLGDGTDIVRKEMYTFKDKGERSLTLKPEGTAPIMRAFNESLQSESFPIKLFYLIPCFRYEKPQNGRLREHHQFGVEYLGSNSDIADSELISLAFMYLNKLGLTDLKITVNSMGCDKCKALYVEALKNYYQDKMDLVCEDCKQRFVRSPLRLLDCKNESCKNIAKNAPKIQDYLCEDCKTHFNAVIDTLQGQSIETEIDSGLIRGQDYYTGIVFEIVQKDGGSILGGGRYNNLAKELGGKDVPAVGFSIGLERLIAKLEASGLIGEDDAKVAVTIIPADNIYKSTAFNLATLLRKSGVACETDICDRSLKANMKFANKINSQNVLVIGEDEVKSGKANIKNMTNGTEQQVKFINDDGKLFADEIINTIINKNI